MKTTPAAVVRVHDGVCTQKEDNGCKHLGNDNEISALSLPEIHAFCFFSSECCYTVKKIIIYQWED